MHCMLSHVQLSETPWTVACQAPIGFSPQGQIFPARILEVGCHFLLQGDLPDQGIEPISLMSPALAGGFFTTSTTWEAIAS